MSPSTKWKVLQCSAHVSMNCMSSLIQACHNMQARYKKRLYIINPPGRKITNCSSHYSHPPHTWRTGAYRLQMRNSHLLLWAATPPVPHIPACGAIPSTIHLIATHTWKDQYHTSKQFLKPFGSGSLTSRFYNTSFIGSCIETKGLNLRHRYVCSILGKKGALTNIHYFLL